MSGPQRVFFRFYGHSDDRLVRECMQKLAVIAVVPDSAILIEEGGTRSMNVAVKPSHTGYLELPSAYRATEFHRNVEVAKVYRGFANRLPGWDRKQTVVHRRKPKDVSFSTGGW